MGFAAGVWVLLLLPWDWVVGDEVNRSIGKERGRDWLRAWRVGEMV